MSPRKSPPYWNAPALVLYLEAAGVEFEQVSRDRLRWSSDRELTAAEIRALKDRKAAVLNYLSARAADRASDVLPALRAMLSEHPDWSSHEALYLAQDLWTWSYLERVPDVGEVEGALAALTVEGRVVA